MLIERVHPLDVTQLGADEERYVEDFVVGALEALEQCEHGKMGGYGGGIDDDIDIVHVQEALGLAGLVGLG